MLIRQKTVNKDSTIGSGGSQKYPQVCFLMCVQVLRSDYLKLAERQEVLGTGMCT